MSNSGKPIHGILTTRRLFDAGRSLFAVGAAAVLAALVCTSCQRFEAVRYALAPHPQYVDSDGPLPPIDQWIEPSRIPLSMARKGVSIDEVVAPIGISTAPLALRVTNGEDCFELVALRELRGLVQISGKSDALDFVQLRTSRSYQYCWATDVAEITKSEPPPKSDVSGPTSSRQSAKTWTPPSGMDAVLSPQAYRAGGFQLPAVRSIEKHYEIVRWVCVFRGMDGKRVQKWQETVAPDGDYTLKILDDRPAPKLPATEWFVPGRL